MHLELFERHRAARRTDAGRTVTARRHRFGSGTPKATWVMRKPDTLRRILNNPALELGETYMDEGWDVTDGSLADLLTILRNNLGDLVQRRTLLSEFAALMQFVERPHGEHRQRPSPLRPRRRAVPRIPRPRHALFVRVFPRQRHVAGVGAAGQVQSHRAQAAARARPARARHRLRLGQPRVASGRNRGRHPSPG